jgi:hypothetical protein
MILVIIGIVAAGVVIYIVKKKKDAAKASEVASRLSTKPRTVTKPVSKPKGTTPGYDSTGQPVKMDNETGPDFKARQAHFYYVQGRG